MKLKFLFWGLLFHSSIVLAQEQTHIYTQYRVEDGLAGSTVYCMLQDRDGFMWFGTETGISKFDGTRFKNFGTAEGLPDNEILEMFADSKGRIWMAPFKKTVCYYYKGKIFNADNDSLLRQVKPNSHILSFAEDKYGDILLMQADQLHIIGKSSVKLIQDIHGRPITNCIAASRSHDGNFLVLERDSLYELSDNKFHFLLDAEINSSTNFKYVTLNQFFLVKTISYYERKVTNLQNKSSFNIPYNRYQLKLALLGDSLLISNNQTGTEIYSLKGKPLKKYLPNKSVSQTLIDNEGSYWFSTLGEGVFRLASENINSIQLRHKSGRRLAAYSLKVHEHKWIVGSDMMYVFQIDYHSPSRVTNKLIWNEYGDELSARVVCVETLPDNRYLIGSDFVLQPIPTSRYNKNKLIIVVKAIYKKSADEFLVGTRTNVITVRTPEMKVLDTIWNERSTAAYMKDDTAYIGTLDGLYLVAKNKTGVFAGKEEPLLRNRVNAIMGSGDGMLWIATNGAGVLGYRNRKIERRIGVNEGLTSNNCRAIWASDNEIWVGTDKGLNRVVFAQDSFLISKFTRGDGLSANVINAVALDGKIVIVGTPEGVNYFMVDSVSFNSTANLVMNDILVSDHHLDPSIRSFTLPHRDNNIQFQFSGISFRSGGEITYRYRLVGLDTSWKVTNDYFLNYPTLPSGNYQLELQAFNKFGIRSRVMIIPFTIEQLLLEKTWFRGLVLSGLLLVSFFFVYWLVSRVRRRDAEKSEIRRRIAELEQLALKSQMNPHFIFNCLNSIQQFVLDKDVEGSNRFITGFSRLIRQTLDISARREITLAEEIIYLSTYLELEKTRFENKFTYEIDIANGTHPEELYIPPMMLQPFVENSIRHGIRYRADSLGQILVRFNKTDGHLVCVIEDNGVGRETSRLLKSKNQIEYQSKGMSLIAARVEFLNKHSTNPITTMIEDLIGENENPAGTRVIMEFPLEHGD